MKILIMTDMEGCAGILNFKDWVEPAGRYYEKGRRFLTNETNAAIDGFFTGGATEVVVLDGHGYGGIDPEFLDERALFRHGHSEKVWPWGLDKTFAAIAFTGQHAKAGTPYSHLTHTDWPNVIDYRINDLSVGEYGQLALCAMELGVPTILACGEKALCEEAEALTPGVVTVAVKTGLLPDDGFRNSTMEEYEAAKLSALHISPSKAMKLIHENALKAINKLKEEPCSFHYPTLSPPYRSMVEYRAYSAKNTAPCTKTAKHPSSIIKLLNTPLENVN